MKIELTEKEETFLLNILTEIDVQTFGSKHNSLKIGKQTEIIDRDVLSQLISKLIQYVNQSPTP